MKERNPIQPTAPQIVGDIEDVESIVTSDNEYIFIKKELSPRTLVSQMLVITSYFENNFNADMPQAYFHRNRLAFQCLLDDMNYMVEAMHNIERQAILKARDTQVFTPKH